MTGAAVPNFFKRANNRIRGFVLSACLLSFTHAYAAGAGSAVCPAATKWTDATRIATTAREPAISIVLERFSNGVHVAMTTEGKLKALMGFKGGMQAVKGEAGAKPKDFFGVDMVAGAPLWYLAAEFPDPCLIEEGRELMLDVRKPGKPGTPDWDFSGHVRRSGGVISFAIATRNPGVPAIALTGAWEYVPQLKSIPEETSLVGWQMFHSNGTPVDTAANDGIATVGALQARFPAAERRP